MSPVIAGLFARHTARIHLEGQAELEREKSRREWRRANVQPLLELAKGRAHACRQVGVAIATGRFEEAWRHLGSVSVTSRVFRDSSFTAVDESSFMAAAQTFVAEDGHCRQTCERVLKEFEQGRLTDEERVAWLRRVGEASHRLSDVYASLDRAAETYVFGPSDSRPHQPAASPRSPWRRSWWRHW